MQTFIQKLIAIFSLLIIGFGGYAILAHLNNPGIGGILIGLIIYPLFKITKDILKKHL